MTRKYPVPKSRITDAQVDLDVRQGRRGKCPACGLYYTLKTLLGRRVLRSHSDGTDRHSQCRGSGMEPERS